MGVGFFEYEISLFVPARLGRPDTLAVNTYHARRRLRQRVFLIRFVAFRIPAARRRVVGADLFLFRSALGKRKKTRQKNARLLGVAGCVNAFAGVALDSGAEPEGLFHLRRSVGARRFFLVPSAIGRQKSSRRPNSVPLG